MEFFKNSKAFSCVKRLLLLWITILLSTNIYASDKEWNGSRHFQAAVNSRECYVEFTVTLSQHEGRYHGSAHATIFIDDNQLFGINGDKSGKKDQMIYKNALGGKLRYKNSDGNFYDLTGTVNCVSYQTTKVDNKFERKGVIRWYYAKDYFSMNNVKIYATGTWSRDGYVNKDHVFNKDLKETLNIGYAITKQKNK